MDLFRSNILHSGLLNVLVDPGVVESIVFFSIYSNWIEGYNRCFTPLSEDKYDALTKLGVGTDSLNFCCDDWINSFCKIIPCCVHSLVNNMRHDSTSTTVNNKQIATIISDKFKNFYIKCWCETLDQLQEDDTNKILETTTIEDIEKMEAKNKRKKEHFKIIDSMNRRIDSLHLEPIEFWMLVFFIYQLKIEKHEEYLKCLLQGEILFGDQVTSKMNSWRNDRLETKNGIVDVEFMMFIMLYNKHV